jgi:acetyl esterase/lipase
LRTTTPMFLAAAAVSAALTAGTLAPVPAVSLAPGETVRTAAATVGVKTVRYGSHARQVMDLYTPASLVGERGKRRGTVVLVHGGAWIKGDKADFAPQARQLARLGYVVASINYRYAQQAAWPAPRTDVINAVKHLRSRAWAFNVDPDRIVLIGSSAGAHLATAAATLGRGRDLVRGVVGMSGPLGMKRVAADPAHSLDKIVTNSLLRCLPSQCEPRYEAATPKNRLSRGDVPSLMFASPNDFVDPQNSVDFVRKAKRVGLSSRMVWMPGDLHGRNYWQYAWPVIKPWLAARMGR